jgi:hypothetical protein
LLLNIGGDNGDDDEQPDVPVSTENENAVCSFINMLTSQTYSDTGEIVPDQQGGEEFAVQASYMTHG